MFRKFLPGLILLFLLISSTSAQSKSYDAERFDVLVAAQADGSLSVEETVTFRFQGGPFSYVFREILTDHTDGVTDIIAGADGVPWPQGTGPGEVEITGNNPIEVVWHLSPTANTDQTFNLAYRMLGVVRRSETADVLDWQALPDDYDYAIESSRVTVSYPSSASLLGPPEILVGEAEVTTGDHQAVFTMQNLEPGDPLVVRLKFAPGTFTGSAPTWQTQTSTQNSRAWIWISAAVAVLGTGFLAIMNATRRRYKTDSSSTDFAQKPPLDMAPALVAYLFSHQISWQHGMATLLDLAGRGLIEIEEIGEKKWYQNSEFTVSLLDQPADLRPHEGALLDILFIDKAGNEQPVVTMSEIGRLITSSRWKGYSESLKADADLAGLLDRESQRKAKRLAIWGVVLMLLGLPLMAFIFLFQAAFGWWPMLLVAAVFLVGMGLTIAGASMSSLSQRGAQLAGAFDPFRRYLQAVAKGKADIPDTAYYEAYLPYAAAFGIAESWLKRQQKDGYEHVPDYFRAMSSSSGAEMVVFIAAISSASNSGGAAAASAAGAAGAGAAGGGASGAG